LALERDLKKMLEDYEVLRREKLGMEQRFVDEMAVKDRENLEHLKEIAESRGELAPYAAAIETKDQEIDCLRRQVIGEKAILQQLSSDYSEKKRAFLRVEEERSRMSEDLASMREEYAKQADQLKQIHQGEVELRWKCEELYKENLALMSSNEAKLADYQRGQEEIVSLREKLAAHRNQLDELENESVLLRNAKEMFERQVGDLDKALFESTVEAEALKAEKIHLLRNLESLQADCNQKSNELEGQGERLRDLDERHQALLHERDMLIKENGQLSVTNAQLAGHQYHFPCPWE
jgi:chromosome segregation ATPase